MSHVSTLPTEEAEALIRRSLVWENHCCLPFDHAEQWMPELDRYRTAGFDMIHVNIGDADVSIERMQQTLTNFRNWLRDRPDGYEIPASAADVLNARRSGRLAVSFDVEGAQAFGNDIGLISRFYEMGVRWLSIVYNRANLLGGGCHDSQDGGLTAFGSRFIAEMDQVGVIKDLAHVGYRTAMDVCLLSSVPVTISHSNPRALTDHPRCVPDDLMKACAATGGVLGISGVGIFLGRNDTSTANVIRSIEYAIDIMGIDHVGIGLDYVFDRGELTGGSEAASWFWPAGFGYGPETQFVPPEQIIDIVSALLERGFRAEDIQKILGGNFLRVAHAVWK